MRPALSRWVHCSPSAFPPCGLSSRRNPESHFAKLYKESQHEGQGGENGGSRSGSLRVGVAGEPLLEGEEFEDGYDGYEDESDE